MAIPVTHYQLEWSPRANKGRITASSGTGSPHVLDVNTSAEFIAIALLLGRPQVTVDNGVFSTGKTPVGK